MIQIGSGIKADEIKKRCVQEWTNKDRGKKVHNKALNWGKVLWNYASK